MNKVNTPEQKNTISSNLSEEISSFPNNIQVLNKFLDEQYYQSTFLNNDQAEFYRLNIYISGLVKIDKTKIKNLQSKTIKKIGSIMMNMTEEEFDVYFANHTGGESYESINLRWQNFFDKYMTFANVLLKNNKLLSNENFYFSNPPYALNTKLLLGKNGKNILDKFQLLYSLENKSFSIGVHTLDDNFIKIFQKYNIGGLKNFYKILLFTNHDRFHNIDIFIEKNQNNEQIQEIVTIKDKKIQVDKNEDYEKLKNYYFYSDTIENINEQEYVSLKEHQTHFVNAYKSNSEFKRYIYKLLQDLVVNLSIIADNLDNNGGYEIGGGDKIDGNMFMQYMLVYTLTFFGRIWNIYTDKYIFGLMSKYHIKLLPIHEDLVKAIWSNNHHFKLLDGKKLTSQEFYGLASRNPQSDNPNNI